MQLTVPANVLLLGEYAVIEEGGMGVTLGVEPRIVATLTEAPRLELVGRWGGRRGASDDDAGAPEDAPEPELFGRAVASVAESLGETIDEIRRLPLHIEVDSTPFYDSAGRKRGLGSSAATAVAVCHSLLALSGSTPPWRLPEAAGGISRNPALLDATFECALRAHRAFQNGRGSGYDVAASLFGGIGRFVGGASPRFTPATLPWLPSLMLFRGRSPVPTRGAVAKYDAWRAAHPGEAGRFLSRSNECVEGFLAAGNWSEAAGWIEAARDLSIELGRAIGAPAEIGRPAGFHGIAKAVGAGNELGVAFGSTGTGGDSTDNLESTLPLRIARGGVAMGGGGEETKSGDDDRT